MKHVFLIDSLDVIKPAKDTSCALMLAAARLGHQVYFAHRGDLSLVAGELLVEAKLFQPVDDEEHFFTEVKPVSLTADQISVFWIRTDPPFDEAYLIDTYLLSQAEMKMTIVNSPNGLRNLQEKIWCQQFTEISPASLITRNYQEYLEFIRGKQKFIVKPLDGFGGSSVFLLDENSSNKRVVFESLSQNSRRYILAQEYIPASTIGDKRILLLEGEPLGSVLRVHSADDHRNNFAAGGTAEQATITETDLKIIETIKPYLKKMDIFFAGIDVIGDKLIEVNVTSPTCLREMERLDKCEYALDVVKAANLRHARRNT